ncbi:uncharacterized protein Z518_02179 [Rhinocladiella mackenziei CBS 650.93]|uniref:Elongator complex protein 6 n=1 Tax=Rhinocladiella mackenziei CBS 650.93 TaxID=1442369 RepID=A0A0D2IW95_9EURO|nr:uncharacterized protein Z518_02179 [Rhinocladiella mackenziei CBS 650.93]KIX07526.1 hypothetical protein Z518_02179 [Rhinocladiella mackenziei CBS 650.93]
MPPIIPPALAAFIQQSLSPHTQTLITPVLSTSSTWLCLRFIYAALYGFEDVDGAPQIGTGSDPTTGIEKVICVSLLMPLSLWVEMGKKMGLDILSLLKSTRLVYVDGLTCGKAASVGSGTGVGTATSHAPTTRLKSLALNDVRDALDMALKAVSSSPSTPPPISTSVSATTKSSTGPAPFRRSPASTSLPGPDSCTKPLILLDGIDFLLASQPSITPMSLQSFLFMLRTQSHTLVVTCHADSPLLHASSATPTGADVGSQLERNHAHFLTNLAHQSRWVFQLRGLDTGSAKDVTGVVRVSRGGDIGVDDENEGKPNIHALRGSDVLADAEWLYQVKCDGSASVWGRGE